MANSNRLIVALDIPERSAIMAMVHRLCGQVGMFKVGLEAFVAHGPGLVLDIRDAGGEIFLDLKVHDIPRTAAAAVLQASKLDVRLMTIHGAGGAEMLQACAEVKPDSMNLLAVTALTSLDDEAIEQIGYGGSVGQMVMRLADLSLRAGCDGLVCSQHELSDLASLPGVRVVPGIRPQGVGTNDQKRVATPAQAVRTGATWIVVGRPVVLAEDPLKVVEDICSELAEIGA